MRHLAAIDVLAPRKRRVIRTRPLIAVSAHLANAIDSCRAWPRSRIVFAAALVVEVGTCTAPIVERIVVGCERDRCQYQSECEEMFHYRLGLVSSVLCSVGGEGLVNKLANYEQTESGPDNSTFVRGFSSNTLASHLRLPASRRAGRHGPAHLFHRLDRSFTGWVGCSSSTFCGFVYGKYYS